MFCLFSAPSCDTLKTHQHHTIYAVLTADVMTAACVCTHVCVYVCVCEFATDEPSMLLLGVLGLLKVVCVLGDDLLCV